jgi:hypothetical protein
MTKLLAQTHYDIKAYLALQLSLAASPLFITFVHFFGSPYTLYPRLLAEVIQVELMSIVIPL